MESADVERLLHLAIGQIAPFAPGCNARKVEYQIRNILRFALLNGEAGIRLGHRRRLERLADKLLTVVETLGVSDDEAFSALPGQLLIKLGDIGVTDIAALRALAGQRLTEHGFVG